MQKTLVKVLRSQNRLCNSCIGRHWIIWKRWDHPKEQSTKRHPTYCQHTLYKKTRASHLTGTNMLESK